MTQRLATENVALGYDGRRIVHDLSLAVPDGSFTAIVGANGSGKSTLLRGLARLLKPVNGTVLLDGKAIHDHPAKEVARRLGLLPQSQTAPETISVADLVARGRYPHQSLLRQWSPADQEAVTTALKLTGTDDLATRAFDELSGGQRQRVWLAMALAQETDILLLDEPTTYLDLSHQVEVLDLLTDLNRDEGATVVIVLHELNLAARYADHLVVMKDGAVVTAGQPTSVLTEEVVTEVFGMRCRVTPDPVSGTPMIVPIGRHHPSPSS
jgi:iron complex transport system ATP-binding protein